MSVVIETTIGDIIVDLFIEERRKACLNFLKLCKLKYYNFNLFHTIEHGFIAQTGDPSGVGDGGESIWSVIEGKSKRYFEAESLPKIRHSTPGLLSMVSVGKNLIGSQFFFTLGTDLTSLDGIHCIIGHVAEGHDILRKLNEAICDAKHRPYQDIRITHTVILDDPFDDPRGFRAPSQSPERTAERLINGRIPADEVIDDTAGKTDSEIHEMLQEREAKARATILEIVGDLPDADVAPPENVLFVCKLNPVTTDNDLEIIFSRFGKVKSCEVIRDRLTGDSLQYAFVEFENSKICENAYFKMDNVLIDDRRIHVDFSQSVSKVRWRGKGKGITYSDERNKSGRLNFNQLNDNRQHNRQYQPSTSKGNRKRSMSPGETPSKPKPSGFTNRYQYDRRNDEEKSRNYRSRSRSRSRDRRHYNDRDYNKASTSTYKRNDKDNDRHIDRKRSYDTDNKRTVSKNYSPDSQTKISRKSSPNRIKEESTDREKHKKDKNKSKTKLAKKKSHKSRKQSSSDDDSTSSSGSNSSTSSSSDDSEKKSKHRHKSSKKKSKHRHRD